MYCSYCSYLLPASHKKYCSTACKRAAESADYRQRHISRYEADPKLCKKCEKPLPYERRQNTFCDHSCAASFNGLGRSRTASSRAKTSEALRAYHPDKSTVNWQDVQIYYDEGHSYRQCQRLFGFSTVAWTEAKKKGLFTSRPKPSFDLAAALTPHSKIGRTQLKAHLIKSGLLPYVCAECGREPQWNDRPLVLILDHINGVNDDHRLENLRFLCPNCDSQMETFCRGTGRKPSISAKKLVEALRATDSIKDALIMLGMAPTGNNYARINRLVS